VILRGDWCNSPDALSDAVHGIIHPSTDSGGLYIDSTVQNFVSVLACSFSYRYHFGEDAADAPDVDRSGVELAA